MSTLTRPWTQEIHCNGCGFDYEFTCNCDPRDEWCNCDECPMCRQIEHALAQQEAGRDE